MLVVFLTMFIGAIFSVVSYIVGEYRKFQAEKDREAELIMRRLKGDELKNTNDIMDQLKAYRATPKKISP